ncbi:RtcB family protein [Arthrobacter monumenti]
MEQINSKLLNWASVLDDKTRDQAVLASSMPFIHPHLALMPDAHLGMGATVGSVIPTLEAVMPAAVGVDIGCGMIAVQSQFTAKDIEGPERRKLRQGIEAVVPMSAGKNNKKLTDSALASVQELKDLADEAHFTPDNYAANWMLQLGTLGSGNHFIEASFDENDDVWLFLHSGSRGVGNKIAQRHIKAAQEWCHKEEIYLPDRDLAYLSEGTPEFDKYIRELRWAQHFALLNREEMMDRVVEQFEKWIGKPVVERERINCHHNFTQQEHHAGKDVWVSRKGAIEARRGMKGVIPGSMGTASYVVEGSGNEASLYSSPHGAGRQYSRNSARKHFTQDQLREAMKGIEYRDTSAFIDEIPAAYKDIDQVMMDAKDLVKVTHTLRQFVNCKGD